MSLHTDHRAALEFTARLERELLFPYRDLRFMIAGGAAAYFRSRSAGADQPEAAGADQPEAAGAARPSKDLDLFLCGVLPLSEGYSFTVIESAIIKDVVARAQELGWKNRRAGDAPFYTAVITLEHPQWPNVQLRLICSCDSGGFQGLELECRFLVTFGDASVANEHGKAWHKRSSKITRCLLVRTPLE